MSATVEARMSGNRRAEERVGKGADIDDGSPISFDREWVKDGQRPPQKNGQRNILRYPNTNDLMQSLVVCPSNMRFIPITSSMVHPLSASDSSELMVKPSGFW